MKTKNDVEQKSPRTLLQNLKLGATVTVKSDHRPGLHKAGGVGFVRGIHKDSTIDVKYSVNGGRENRISLSRVKLGVDPSFADPPKGGSSSSSSSRTSSRMSTRRSTIVGATN